MSVRKVKPLGNHILVRREEAVMSRGGILLPDSSREKPRSGEVLAVGSGKVDDQGKTIPMDVKVGDRIFFGGFAGREVEMAEEGEYLVMSEDDVLVVVD